LIAPVNAALLIVLLGLIATAAALLCPKRPRESSGPFLSRDASNTLRGLAILLVVVHHMGNAAGVRWFTPLGPVGVGIFLLLSGFGTSYSVMHRSPGEFWRRRLARVLVPYLLAIIGQAAYSLFSRASASAGPASEAALLLDLAWHRYWFIPLIFFWYGVSFLSSRLSRFPPMAMLAMLAAAVGVLVAPLPRCIAAHALSFVLGVLLFQHKEALHRILGAGARPYLVGALLGMGGLACLALKQVPAVRGAISDSTGVHLALQIPMICLLAMAATVCVHGGVPWRALALPRLVAPYAYEVYLCHMMVSGVIDPGAGYVWTCLVFLAMTALLAMALHGLTRVVNKMVALDTADDGSAPKVGSCTTTQRAADVTES